MDISTLSGLSGTQNKQSLEKASNKLQEAIASLVTGTRINKAADDVAALSIATQLQSNTASLRQASGNLASASTLAQVADGGAQQIQDALERLKEIAQQAGSPTLGDDLRQALNNEFKQLKQEIDRLAENTTFGGQKLLDGELTGDNALTVGGLITGESGEDETGKLEVEALTTEELFDGADLNVLTGENAQAAVEAIDTAIKEVTGTRADIGAFQQTLGFAAANIDSAVNNQEAARAILQDTDFTQAATDSFLANLQRNASLAVAAQSKRLNPTLIQLLS